MKLRTRLLGACLAVLALAMGLIGGVLIAGTFSAQMDQAVAALDARGGDARSAMEAAAVNYALQGMELSEELARGIAAQVGASLTSEGEPEGISLADERLRLVRGVKLGGLECSFAIEESVHGLYEMRRAMLGWYAVLYAATLAVCALALAAVARGLTRPLENLACISARIASGEYGLRAPPGEGETGELAGAFNNMAGELVGQMAQRDRFIAALSHEMKTPLTSMMGHAELIRSGRLPDDEVMMAAQYIFREGRRLSDMSERLMRMVLLREDAAEFRVLAADWLAQGVCDAARPRAQAQGVALKCKVQPLCVRADDPLLRTLLSNLLDNALKSGATHVAVSVNREECRVCFAVSDDGRGMDSGELARITEPFYRVDKSRARSQGGAGLGLALCAEIARLHGGQLRFESAPGAGTRAMLLMEEANKHDEDG